STVSTAPGWPHEETLDGLRHDVARGDERGTGWFVRRHDGRVIGDCGWSGGPGPGGTAELSYALAAPFRRRGYATEAVGAFAAWALARPGCARLVARVLADNLASRRLLDRLGFGLDGVAAGWLWYRREADEPALETPAVRTPGQREPERERTSAPKRGPGPATGAGTASSPR
ncbi:MAG TPA: GNAT family N-acetyltransferase, partial [Mycobacteriales bacterium]|nr:GNAT family N-acetyltransferase [Mycobacteriales bacterium]